MKKNDVKMGLIVGCQDSLMQLQNYLLLRSVSYGDYIYYCFTDYFSTLQFYSFNKTK